LNRYPVDTETAGSVLEPIDVMAATTPPTTA
jgi:hypothetical protein